MHEFFKYFKWQPYWANQKLRGIVQSYRFSTQQTDQDESDFRRWSELSMTINEKQLLNNPYQEESLIHSQQCNWIICREDP